MPTLRNTGKYRIWYSNPKASWKERKGYIEAAAETAFEMADGTACQAQRLRQGMKFKNGRVVTKISGIGTMQVFSQ